MTLSLCDNLVLSTSMITWMEKYHGMEPFHGSLKEAVMVLNPSLTNFMKEGQGMYLGSS